MEVQEKPRETQAVSVSQSVSQSVRAHSAWFIQSQQGNDCVTTIF